MAGLLSQLKGVNQNLTLNQKLSIVTLGTVILFGILSFVYLMNQDDYQPLISELDGGDIRQVVQRLQQRDIPYKLSSAGNGVMVPARHLDEARLEIAADGLTSRGRVGFELFDESGWNITNFAEQVNYRRALEGEIQQTIESLSEVKGARVHIALPKKTLFSEERERATASVVLILGGDQSLARKKVMAIRNIVSSGVEGLDAANVSVASSNGILLSENDDDSAMVNERQIRFRKTMEDELTRKVIAILEPTVGENKVKVRTSITLDFSEMQRKEVLREPVIVSEKSSRRPARGSESIGGIPGVQANAGGDVNTGAEDSTQVWTEELKNYDFSTFERILKSPSGTVERISMAVIVDDKTVQDDSAAGQTGEGKQPWEAEHLDKLRSLVASTIGLKPERGDQLTLENISFLTQPIQPPVVVEPGFMDKNKDLLLQGLRYFAIIALFLLFYMMIFRPVKNRVFSYMEQQRKELAQYNQAQLQAGGGQLDGSGQLALPEGTPGRVGANIESEVVNLARKDPEAVSGLVRDWMSQES